MKKINTLQSLYISFLLISADIFIEKYDIDDRVLVTLAVMNELSFAEKGNVQREGRNLRFLPFPLLA